MSDYTFLISVVFLFMIALFGAWVRIRQKDRCLADFEKFHVTLAQTDNKHIWGMLVLASTGLELLYRHAVQDKQHLESSYILYKKEFSKIQAFYRYGDQLTEENKGRRDEEIEKAFNPSFWRKSKRQLQNTISITSDAINDVLGLFLGQAQKPYVTSQSQGQIKKFGGDLIGYVGGAFEPLLEQLIGLKVVVEIIEDNEIHEHVGIFKNYSSDFIEILDVQFPQKKLIEIDVIEGGKGHGIDVMMEGKQIIQVHNHTPNPVSVQNLVIEDEQQLVNVIVDSAGKITFQAERSFSKASLQIRMVRELDMIVPRTHCVVRHRAGEYPTRRLTDFIFDLGIALYPNDQKLLAQEKKLREQLKQNDKDALAAANLGGLLIQKEAYEEAEKWLQLALSLQQSLPDNGRSVRSQLRQLQSRLTETDPHHEMAPTT